MTHGERYLPGYVQQERYTTRVCTAGEVYHPGIAPVRDTYPGIAPVRDTYPGMYSGVYHPGMYSGVYHPDMYSRVHHPGIYHPMYSRVHYPPTMLLPGTLSALCTVRDDNTLGSRREKPLGGSLSASLMS